MTAFPPVLVGADQDTCSVWFPRTTVEFMVGAPGIVRGIAATIPDRAPPPRALNACTRNSYVVPFVKPVIVLVSADVTRGVHEPVEPARYDTV